MIVKFKSITQDKDEQYLIKYVIEDRKIKSVVTLSFDPCDDIPLQEAIADGQVHAIEEYKKR